MSQVMKRMVVFVVVFLFISLCSLVLALCSGVPFGTSEFGWLIGGGMLIGCGLGGVVAAFPSKI